jgi:murein DD-endopeptidase MepM/ murein hydrolase activator NlpD
MLNFVGFNIGNIISFCLFVALLGCSQSASYAPVKIVNETFIPEGVIASRSKIQRNLAKSDIKKNIQEKTPHNNDDSMPLNSYVNRSSADFNSQPTGVIGADKRRGRDKKLKAATPQRLESQPHAKVVRSLPKISKTTNEEKSLDTQNNPYTPVDHKKNNEKISIISNNNKKVLKLNFEWPVSGKVVRSFGQSDSKGIDISVKNGQKVRAAESGKAVYCGSGLAGYGNLVIIKHNQDYLSAYANNRRLSVKEGQMVDKGQPIGELDLAGFRKSILHFEIRKNGKAINPLTLLPKF